MKIEFPYVQKEKSAYPMVDITLSKGHKIITVKALVDSGASFSVFRPEIARYLGIAIEKGKSLYLEGLGGRIFGYLHNISVQAGKKRFKCKIVFSNELTISFNLLGRDNFFKYFLVMFDERRKKTILGL